MFRINLLASLALLPCASLFSRDSMAAPAPSMHGQWRTELGSRIFVVAHPAALLRAGECIGSAGYLRWAMQIRDFLRAEE